LVFIGQTACFGGLVVGSVLAVVLERRVLGAISLLFALVSLVPLMFLSLNPSLRIRAEEIDDFLDDSEEFYFEVERDYREAGY
jgi:hypothetical protein